MKRMVYFLMVSFLLTASVGCTKRNPENYNKEALLATLFHQQAAEMKALSYQAYNLAKRQLDEALLENENPGSLAIVLDLDETVLDNSPHQAECIIKNFNYPTGWAEWCQKAEAPALPGAVAFLKKAVDYGVQVFYISNRNDSLRDVTKENFVKEEIPLQSEDHLLLKTTESGKENRRQTISQQYKIIMLIGDNLSDFHQVFDKQTVEQRAALTDSLQSEFGSRFIVLPNAMYGDWLNALNNYDYKMSAEEKSVLYNKLLKGFGYVKPAE